MKVETDGEFVAGRVCAGLNGDGERGSEEPTLTLATEPGADIAPGFRAAMFALLLTFALALIIGGGDNEIPFAGDPGRDLPE